jgi:ABC-type antimicrobial peptide transport system permease subunit
MWWVFFWLALLSVVSYKNRFPVLHDIGMIDLVYAVDSLISLQFRRLGGL